MLLLIQSTYDGAIQVLWVTLFVLLVLTLLLFATSLYMRWLHKRIEDKLAFYKEKFYPIILEYIETGENRNELLPKFTGRNIEYSAFEKVVVDLLEYVQGNDAEKLRKLLFIDPIFNFHLKQLDAKSTVVQVKACIYFSKTRLVNNKIIEKLKKLSKHKNRFLAFAAASALMASPSVEVRAYALEMMAKRAQISEMALLELLYRFKYRHDDQLEEEVKHLQRIIELEDVLSDNRALLILGVSEMSYFHLAAFFYELLLREEKIWNVPSVKTSLVYAQEYFLNDEASEYMRKLIHSNEMDIKHAAIEVLSKFRGEENEEEIFKQVNGNDQELDFFIVKTLMEEGYAAHDIAIKSTEVEIPYVNQVIEMVKPELEIAR